MLDNRNKLLIGIGLLIVILVVVVSFFANAPDNSGTTNLTPYPTPGQKTTVGEFEIYDVVIDDQERTIVAGSLIVQLADSIKESQMQSVWDELGATRAKDIGLGFWQLTFDDEVNIVEKYYVAQEMPQIKLADLDEVMEQTQSTYDPDDDELFAPSWWWDMIDARAAWENGINSYRGDLVKVGILDDQVDEDHVELFGRVTLETDEIPPAEHGTKVAGLIGAKSNNGQGIASMAHNNAEMYSTIGCVLGICPLQLVLSGFETLMTQDMEVINMSLSSDADNEVVQALMQAAWDEGIVLVASAGNEGTDAARYPAAYDIVIGVASVGQSADRSEFSSFGNWVNVAAPGEQIMTTSLENTIIAASGTSFATPIVAGLAALCFSVNPELTNGDVFDFLTSNVTPNTFTSSGLINADGMMQDCVAAGTTPTPVPSVSATPTPPTSPSPTPPEADITTWEHLCEPYYVEVIGEGMGDPETAINPKSITLDDPTNVQDVLLQAVGRQNRRNITLPSQAIFTDSGEGVVTVTERTDDAFNRSWSFEAEMEPNEEYTVHLDSTGDDSYQVPRALIAYTTRNSEVDWTSIGGITDGFVYGKGCDEGATDCEFELHEEAVTLPERTVDGDIYATVVVIDNDHSEQELTVTMQIGDRDAFQTESVSINGTELSLFNLAVADVVYDVTDLTLSVVSEPGFGESAVMVGYNITYPCDGIAPEDPFPVTTAVPSPPPNDAGESTGGTGTGTGGSGEGTGGVAPTAVPTPVDESAVEQIVEAIEQLLEELMELINQLLELIGLYEPPPNVDPPVTTVVPTPGDNGDDDDDDDDDDIVGQDPPAATPTSPIGADPTVTSTPTVASTPGSSPTAIPTGADTGSIPTEENLKVAFIGDSGDGNQFRDVLELIAGENVDLVLHQGDFSYRSSISQWEQHINQALGSSFPYLGSDGNHENWSSYDSFFENRLSQMGLNTSIDSRGNYAITWKGLRMVFVQENGNPNFINQSLANDEHTWQVCSWHKNQTALQLGTKGNEQGWPDYQNCLKKGAIIATGHEHSYERTKTLRYRPTLQSGDVEIASGSRIILDRTVGSVSACEQNDVVCSSLNKSFVFVSGLGGKGVRNQDRCSNGCNGEWASIYTSDQGAKFGALFIEFFVDGDPNKARGYFKTIQNNIIDDFEIIKQ